MSYEPEYPEPTPPGPKASFTITCETFDTSTFYADVVNSAVERMMGSSWSPAQLQRDIQKAVQAKVDERLNAVLEQTVADMLSKPIQKFDTFGNPVGEPLAVEDIVRNGATMFLTETVDSQGRPTKDHYSTKKTRLEWLIESGVVGGLAKEMKAETEKVRAALLQRASAAAAAVLAGVK